MERHGSHGSWQEDVRFPLAIIALVVLILGFGGFHHCRAAGGISTAAGDAAVQQGQATNTESELQTGIELTQNGRFKDAIPYLIAARGRVADEYAANFDLALCYVATEKFQEAIEILGSLKNGGHSTAAVNNLLAQALIGAGQPDKALEAFRAAAQETPTDEKLYVLVAEACMEHGLYDLGIQVVNTGLEHLPDSARLHYERGTFFAYENQVDQASSEYEVAEKLAPGTNVFYIAAAQNDQLQGKIQDAIRVARRGIQSGDDHYILLTIFGDAVARAGVGPGQPLFAEAQQALEKSIAERPAYEASQLALGELLLTAGRIDEAMNHLARARELAPTDPAVYSHLAMAYRRAGSTGQEQEMLAILAKINQQQAQKYKTDSPNKAGYVASAPVNHKPSP